MASGGKGDSTLLEHVITAPPPWHSVALVVLLFSIFVRWIPSWESIDEVATIETFSRRVFPELISLRTLVVVRAVFSAMILGLTAYQIIFGIGWDQVTTYLAVSKLKRHVTIPMHGIRTTMPFTSWSWNLLGVSFGLNAWISWCALQGKQDSIHPWILRAALLMFETAAPCALLVAFVVRYGIWPQVLASGKGKDPTGVLKLPRTLMMHNANVIMALTEVSLLGGVPVRAIDFAMSAFFGLTYILFTWATMHYWVPREGPQFLYFFMDTTLGATTTIALLALLVVLVVFYGLFCGMHQILDHLGGGPLVHSLAIFVVSSLVCRFRD